MTMTPQTFRQAETVRWSGQAGDYVLWMRMASPFASNPNWNILDFWALTNGDTVTLTNQWDDLPPWFHLHPLEVANSLCSRMGAKLAAGYEPEEVTSGPGLWWVLAGDRLVRVGVDRADADGNDGVLAIVSFDYSALAYGDGSGSAQELIFGVPNADALPHDKKRFRAEYLAGVKEGSPRCLETEWRLG
jgi:hypothetical protein